MTFDDLGLNARLLTRLRAAGMTTPTPIQAQAIPHALSGRDVMGLAQTGTGKTAAFGLPLIQALMRNPQPAEGKCVRALILAPTRELAKQIAHALGAFTQGGHLRVLTVVGGVSLNRQVSALSKGADLLIATPGRLIDLMDRKAIRLDQTGFLVLDEADQMLDMGFLQALKRIAPHLPKDRQTMMFSATMPRQMADLSAQFLTDPVRVEVARPGLAVEKIRQMVHFVPQAEKAARLYELLAEEAPERAVIFARTKHGAERLMKKLVARGASAASIHGNKSQGQRDRALQGFKGGQVQLLVATDVAARGIDIPDVTHVYNFDLPNVAENYVHRIGRTGRAGAAGRAISLCAPDEMSDLKAIEKVLGQPVPVASGTPFVVAGADAPKPKAKRRRRSRGRGPSGRAAQAA